MSFLRKVSETRWKLTVAAPALPARLPDRSPASSVVVYMSGKPLWASKAAESDSPVLTRAATSSAARQMRIFLVLGQHLQRAEDGQAGADEGEELLVEDEERSRA